MQTQELARLMALDIWRRIKLHRKWFLLLPVVFGFFGCGLFYAWVIDPVEWDYSQIERPPVTIYDFPTQTQEVIVLGITALAFETRGSDASKLVVNKTLADLRVNSQTLCDVHYTYGSYMQETTYILQELGVSCIP